jgi:hypothetical protein
MSFEHHFRQDMESASSPVHDKSDTNCTSEFKSPDTSSFYDQNVKSSTPLSNHQEKEYGDQWHTESHEPSMESLVNGFLQLRTNDGLANQQGPNDSGQTSTDWFGLSAPKFGTFIRSRIFVGGISSQTTEIELTDLFSQFGQVKASKIIVDRAGVSKGYGFVTFETERDSEALCNLIKNKEIGPIMLRERRLNVAPAVKKQIGYRSDFPYPANNFHPNPQVWKDGFYPATGFPGMYNNQHQSFHQHNQLDEYWQGQAQNQTGQQNFLVNTALSLQTMPVYFAPPPYPFPNFHQLPYCPPDAINSYPCHPPPWCNLGPSYPSLATQNNINNIQNGGPFQNGNGNCGPGFHLAQLPTPDIINGTGFDCLPAKDKIRSFNTNSTTYFPRMADSTD